MPLIKRFYDSLISEKLNFFDYSIFVILFVVCFFSFQQGDMWHTSASSLAYLDGNIFSFYDYNKSAKNLIDVYMPSTYIIFAIWNIPLYIVSKIASIDLYTYGKLLMYYGKILTTLVYFATAYIIFKMAIHFGLSKVNARLTAYAFITMPIAFFSQFIFGQYDIFTTFFIVLGMYFYFKGNNKGFIISFASAITFKYFALLFFIPLLLLREKRISRILLSMLAVGSIFMLEFLIYFKTGSFISNVFGFHAVNALTFTQFSRPPYQIYVSYFIFIMIFAYAYFKDMNTPKSAVGGEDNTKNNEIKWSLYLLSGISFASFGISHWHPQWLLICIPILVLSTVINKRSEIIFYTDIILAYSFITLTITMFPDNVDTNLIVWSVVSQFLTVNYSDLNMLSNHVYLKDSNLVMTIFVAAMFVNFIFKHPKYCVDDIRKDIIISKLAINIRFAIGVLLFVIPAFVELYSGVKVLAENNKIFEQSTKKVYDIFSLSKSEAMSGISSFNVDGDRLIVDADSDDAMVFVPTIDIKNRGYIIFEVADDINSTFDLFYLSKSNETYSEDKKLVFDTSKSKVFKKVIPKNALGKGLRFDIGTKPGKYVIKRFEIYSE